MDLGKEGNAIKGLAHEWTRVQVPTAQVGYSDYLSALSGLNTVTADLEKTAFLFRGVLQQATQLDRSAQWVVRELSFEADALVSGDRQKRMRYCVHHTGAGSDASLDLYNERLNRFKVMSIHYQVQFQRALLSGWAPVKTMARIAGQLVVEVDGEERLTFYQAWCRRAQLSLRFPIFSFRVTEQK